MSDYELAPCIYCGSMINPRLGQGDHVIPLALGRFRDALIFRQICRDCNTRIAHAEEVLIRCGPEAVLKRHIESALARKGRLKRGRKSVAAKGGSRPRGVIKHADHTELVNFLSDDPDEVVTFDQLVICDVEGLEHHLLLFPEMNAASLRRKINGASPSPDCRMYLHAEEAHYRCYVGILAELYPDSPCVEVESQEPGFHCVQGRMEFNVTVDYFRALAKIAFHYYLTVNQRGLLGCEPMFDSIRRFIMEGGDHREFFDVDGARFESPFGRLPSGYSLLSGVFAHSLAADEGTDIATGNVMLFAGPKVPPPMSRNVRLARVRSPIFLREGQIAHRYIYYDKPAKDGCSGFVEKGSVSRIR